MDTVTSTAVTSTVDILIAKGLLKSKTVNQLTVASMLETTTRLMQADKKSAESTLLSIRHQMSRYVSNTVLTYAKTPK